MPCNMDSNPKTWNSKYIMSDEGKKRIEEIVDQVKVQGGREVGIFVDKMLKVINKKIIEAENTRREMKPTIERDFGLIPDPDKFKVFLINYLEELVKTIKLPDSQLKYNDLPVKLNKSLDSYLLQIDLLAEQIDLDKLLQDYGERRVNEYNKSKIWYGTYKGLKDSGYIETSEKTFDHVMMHRYRPKGADKILWKTVKADALYFQKNLGFSMPQFNNCFRSEDVYPFKEGQRAKTPRNKNLQNIVKTALKILHNS